MLLFGPKNVLVRHIFDKLKDIEKGRNMYSVYIYNMKGENNNLEAKEMEIVTFERRLCFDEHKKYGINIG